MINAQPVNLNGVFPRFYKQAVEDKKASLENGRRIYKEVDYVEISIAGDKSTRINRKVSQNDIDRWPTIYKAFKNDEEQELQGTPLKLWPVLNLAQVEEFKVMNVHTVEQLADLPDVHLQNLGMGARDFQSQAKAFILASSDTGKVAELVSKLEKKDQEISSLNNQLKDLASKVADLSKKK